jgi:hypothetical protein
MPWFAVRIVEGDNERYAVAANAAFSSVEAAQALAEGWDEHGGETDALQNRHRVVVVEAGSPRHAAEVAGQ